MKTFLAALACILTGCASINQTVRTETRGTNGTVEIRETRNRAVALWDAQNAIDKLRVSNGKTHSIGLAGVEEAATSTNTVAALEAIARIVGGLK